MMRFTTLAVVLALVSVHHGAASAQTTTAATQSVSSTAPSSTTTTTLATCTAASLVASFGNDVLWDSLVHNCDGVLEGSTCTMGCNSTRMLTGTPQLLTCTANSTFSGTLPTCFPPCDASEDDGSLVERDCSNHVAVGDSCMWTCAHGYAGDAVQRTCATINATTLTVGFEPAPPVCSPVECQLPADANQESMDLSDCEGALHTNTCVVPCRQGYAGAPSTLQCDNGLFAGDLPTCIAKRPIVRTAGGTLKIEVFDDRTADLVYKDNTNAPQPWSGRLLSDVEIEASIISSISAIMEDEEARVRTEEKVRDLVAADVLAGSGEIRAAVQSVVDANAPSGDSLTTYLEETTASLEQARDEVSTDLIESINALQSDIAATNGAVDGIKATALPSLETKIADGDDAVLAELRSEMAGAITTATNTFNSAIEGVADEVGQLEERISSVETVTNGLGDVSGAVERCLKLCPPGQYISQWCTSSSANECSNCPAHTFNPSTGLESSCRDCSPSHCPAGTYIVPCDRTVGTSQCPACPGGKYQDASNHRHTTCKTCSCPGGHYPLSTTCPKTSNFDCLPGGISVIASDSCSAGYWRMGGAEGGCKGNSGYGGTRLQGGDYGSNYDVTAISTVKIAAGRYRFYCAADDCCRIHLSGPRSFYAINHGCGGCTSCSGHTHDHDLPAGEYRVQYYMHEFSGGAWYDFRFWRI